MSCPEARILTWNVKNHTEPEDAFEHVIAQAGWVDVVCLQELMLRRGRRAEDILALGRQMLAMDDGVIVSAHTCRPRPFSDPSVENLATFTASPILGAERRELSSGDLTLVPSKRSATRKFLATTVLPRDWLATLTVAHNHLTFPVGPGGIVNKKQQDEEYEKLIYEILPDADFSENFVLQGDFNAEPESRLIKAIRKYLNFVGGEPIYDTQATGHRGKSSFKTVDYVFATPDLEGTVRKLQRGPSDHAPLLTTIRRR